MGLVFETAAVEAIEGEEGTLTLNGKELTYYRPGKGQIAAVMALTERHQADQRKVAALINFFFSIFEDSAAKHLEARLWDRKDSFDVDSKGGINDIVEALMQEWAGRPTLRSSASTESPATTGL